MATQLNVREFIDEQPLSGFQKWIIALCLLVVIVDGLDVAVMGFIAPSLKEQWGISNSDLAPVISAALFGLTIGAMVAGPMADKFGRKKVLLVCVGLWLVYLGRCAGRFGVAFGGVALHCWPVYGRSDAAMRDLGDRILTQTHHFFLNHRGDLWFFFGRSHGWLFGFVVDSCVWLAVDVGGGRYCALPVGLGVDLEAA